MMIALSYRDDRDALLWRNDELADENRRLREALTKSRTADPSPDETNAGESEAEQGAAPDDDASVRVFAMDTSSPLPRPLGPRPWWFYLIAVPITGLYGFAVVITLVSLVLGRDPIAPWGILWYHGIAACLAMLVAIVLSSGYSESEPRASRPPPRWLVPGVLAHLGLAGSLIAVVGFAGKPALYANEGASLFFLFWGMGATWHNGRQLLLAAA